MITSQTVDQTDDEPRHVATRLVSATAAPPDLRREGEDEMRYSK
jgi:hypothetical protein